MYGYLDLTFFLLCLYSFIYGILVTQDEDYMGYDNAAFWIVIGVLGLFVYPVILESILHLYAHTESTPEAPYEEYHAKLPIVYSHNYNITACGIEKLHPFDAQKYGKGKISFSLYFLM